MSNLAELATEETETKEETKVERTPMPEFSTVIEDTTLDNVVSDAVNYNVELRPMQTVDGLMVPDSRFRAVVRQNTNGSEQVLSIVGWRYKILDHKAILKSVANVFKDYEIPVKNVHHELYKDGSRVYSGFNVDEVYSMMNEGEPFTVSPVVNIVTSHDGSHRLFVRLSVLMTTKEKVYRYPLSSTVCSLGTKHVKGAKSEEILKVIRKVIDEFSTKVLPRWNNMTSTKIDLLKAQNIMRKAVESGAICERASEKVNLSCATLFDLYQSAMNTVCSAKEGKEENSINRGIKVDQFFSSLPTSVLEMSAAS